MSAERWQRVGALFDRALATPPSSRLEVVRASSEPQDVQDEVVELLKSHEASDGFLEPPSILEDGATIGAYRIDRILGRGGMGVVYLAQDTRLHRPVALKALPPQLFRDDTMRARLRQEARAAAALSHPSIATVFALEEVGGQILIASEYIEGPTLREEISKGLMPMDRALDIAQQIASALTAAHARGITHRDLKPENVILTNSGSAKVVDFGLAQFDVAAQDLASVTRLTEIGVIQGTPPYMAPEQLLGQPTSSRTDQFAFGVLLYELLTGRHPFGGGPLPATIARTIATEPDPADLPPHLWSLITRAIQKNPEERFATTSDLAAALSSSAPRHQRSPAPRPVDTARTAFRWWRIHQLIVAWTYWSMVYPAWHVHQWTGRWGVITFFVTLAIVIVGANTRFHLAFTASTYPEQLSAQRKKIGAMVFAADVGFSLMMMATGLVIAGDHTGWGALMAAFGLGAAIGFVLIEPTTARAAFGDEA
ncbi:MAG: serine/threonine-protein kinase [Acidimicrobiia bacterium]